MTYEIIREIFEEIRIDFEGLDERLDFIENAKYGFLKMIPRVN